MKKIILIFLFFIPIVVSAQRFKGGVVLGMNVSQIDGDNLAGYNKAGMVGGAFVFTDFKDKWGAQMEIRYAAKGSATPKYYSFDRKFRLQYIEVPILAYYEPVNKLKLQFGLSFGYLFSAAQNDGYGYEKFEETPSRGEVAVCAGINYSLTKHIDVNARFAYSVLPIESDYTGESWGSGAKFNNVLTFAIYYRIGGYNN
jgi:hypothetical protein